MMLPSNTVLCEAMVASYKLVPAVTNDDVRLAITKPNGINIAAFPGTRETELEDWVIDLSAMPHDVIDCPELGLCHYGLQTQIAKAFSALEAAIGSDPYILLGHSLGGGYALMFGARMTLRGKPPLLLTTAGALRVSVQHKVSEILKPVPGLRLHNGNDPVPSIPPWPYNDDRPLTNFGMKLDNPIDCHFITSYAVDAWLTDPA